MTASTTAAGTYRKTKAGAWVVFAPRTVLTAAVDHDGRVSVVKRSGEGKVETIDGVGRGFQVDGVEMAYGYITQRAECETAPRSAPSRRPGKGGICDDCQRPRRNLQECVDSSGISGLCCPSCAAMSPYERSFA